MIDLKKLAKLIAAAPLSKGERDAYIKLIPKLPAEHVETLMVLLEKQTRALKQIRSTHAVQIRKVVDEKKIEQLKRKILKKPNDG